ncbi:hypothetical protein [Nonomuraea endophytica]|uniref:hypothetical protein n=1 Tax=Nonomuraea endophytica TaxID=714136 RepID=UPI0037C677E4
MSADKRRQHAEARIAQARQPWSAWLKAAEWLASEIKRLAEHDPERARGIAEGLREQTRLFADDLNREDATRVRRR